MPDLTWPQVAALLIGAGFAVMLVMTITGIVVGILAMRRKDF